MDFVSMLQQVNAAISEPARTKEPVKCAGPRTPTGGLKDMTHVYMARVVKCREDYRKAMFNPSKKEQEWMTLSKIELKSGKVKGGSYDTVQNMVRDKLIERRPFGGRPFNRRHGWEYRWIGG